MLGWMLAQAVLAVAAPPPCRAGQIVLSLDGRTGDFDGMSHAGTLVVLTNRSRRACALPALPLVAMLDRRGRALPIARQVPVGLHPGPAMVPVRLAPGAAVSTPLRWASGEVYDRSRCYTPARLAVVIAGARLAVPLTAHVCGPADGRTEFTQLPLRPGLASGE